MRSRRLALEIAAAMLLALPAAAQPATRFPDATAVLLGIGFGALHVDLPDPDEPGKRFGTHPRLHLDLGWEMRPWLEIGADVGFGLLGESDSLNAVLEARQASGVAHVTLVNAGLNVRARWLFGSGRWAPFVRAGAGGTTLTISAPLGLGSRTNDAALNAGGGFETYVHGRLVLRAEGLEMAQFAAGGTRHHTAVSLALLYALPRASLTTSPAR